MWRELRVAALGGLAVGLALSPLLPGAGGKDVTLALAGAAALLVATRPRGRGASLPWIALVALVATLAGGLLGAARVRALDAGALRGEAGSRLLVRGHVSSVPRRSGGVTRVEAETPSGRLLI